MTRDEVTFVKKLRECVNEYKKQLRETDTDEDAARFFNKNLTKWIFNYINEIDILATIGLNKSFVTFVKHYLIEYRD